MTDSTLTVLPASDVALGGWTLTGGASAHAVLSDASDASYVDPAGSVGAVLRVGLAAATLGPYDLLRYVRPWIRAATPDSVARTVAVRLYGNGVHQITPEQKVTLSGTPTKYYLLPYQGWPTGRPFAAADLAAMFLAIRETYSPIGAARLYEAGVDLVFNGAPTVVVTFPTGVPIADNGLVSPTWSYCVDEETEALTDRGWLRYWQIEEGDRLLTLDHDTGLSEWQEPSAVNVFPAASRQMLSMEGSSHSSLTTLAHRWPVEHWTQRQKGGPHVLGRRFVTSGTLSHSDRIPCAAPCVGLPPEPKWSDAFVELLAWYWTEGEELPGERVGVRIYQSAKVNGPYVDRIRRCLSVLYGDAHSGPMPRLHRTPLWREIPMDDKVRFSLNGAAAESLRRCAPHRIVDPGFIASLTTAQLSLFVETSIDADGSRYHRKREVTQGDPARLDALQMACSLLGQRTTLHRYKQKDGYSWTLQMLSHPHIRPVLAASHAKAGRNGKFRMDVVSHEGMVWCPTTPNGTWFARRNGSAYFTGNSDPEGDLQGRYQLRIYGVPPSGWPAAGLSNDAQIAALEAANVQPIADVEEIGDLAFAAPVLMPPFGTFRLYLRASDQNSNGRYGSWQRTDFTTAILDAPAMPVLVVTPDATVARVRIDLTPGAGSLDYYELQRSADGGGSWQTVLGMRPTLPFVSASANVLDGSAFASDGNGDGVADDWGLYSTGGGDAAPTGSIVAGVGGGNAQRVTWTTNTGAKGVGTAPRTASTGTDTWQANSEWLMSFQYATDFADASMLPELDFDVGGFAVTWLEQPTPSGAFQRYTARVVAPGADTVSEVYVASTGGANHRFDLAQPQLIAEAKLAQTGIGVPEIGSEPMGGPGGPATVTNPLTPPAWTARESTPTTVYDRTAPREGPLLYRARAVALSGSGGAYGATAKASPWRTSAPTTLASDGNTWVHSSSDGGIDAPFCDARTIMVGVASEDLAAYSAEGREDLIVVGGTVHTETLGGFTFAFADDAEWERFVLLRSLREPLLVQTLYGQGPLEQFWCRIGADVTTERHGAYVGQRQAQVRIATFDAWQVAEPA